MGEGKGKKCVWTQSTTQAAQTSSISKAREVDILEAINVLHNC